MFTKNPWFLQFFAAEPEPGGSEQPPADTKPETPDEESQKPESGDSVSDDTDDDSTWQAVFPGKTPKQVLDQVEKWKKHARTWERRNDEHKAELEKLKSRSADLPDPAEFDLLKEQNTQLSRQVSLVGALSLCGADIAAYMDSRSFMDAAMKLDPSTDDYGEQVKTLVERRAGATPPPPTGGLNGRESSANSGPSLYDLAHPKNNRKET